jgi:hypothetical protein
MRGEGGVAGSQPMGTAVHITWYGAQINFGYLPPYLAYAKRRVPLVVGMEYCRTWIVTIVYICSIIIVIIINTKRIIFY